MYIIYIQTSGGKYVHDTNKTSLVGIHCAHRVTVTGVRRVGTEKHVGGGNNIYCI